MNLQEKMTARLLKVVEKNLLEKNVYGRIQKALDRDFREFIMNFNSDKPPIVLDLGTYNRRFYPGTLNVDINDGEDADIDIQCDFSEMQLPIQENVIDFVACTAVLEHVQRPDFVVSEILRVLKPGGYAWVDIPFMQPFHAAPSDYQRYTSEGIKYLFRNFDIVKTGPIGGSAFALSWIMKEFFGAMSREDIKRYPSLNNVFENLAVIDLESNKFDAEMENRYDLNYPENFKKTACGNYVYVKKK